MLLCPSHFTRTKQRHSARGLFCPKLWRWKPLKRTIVVELSWESISVHVSTLERLVHIPPQNVGLSQAKPKSRPDFSCHQPLLVDPHRFLEQMAVSELWIPKHHSHFSSLSHDGSRPGCVPEIGVVQQEKHPHHECVTTELNFLRICGVYEPFFTE